MVDVYSRRDGSASDQERRIIASLLMLMDSLHQDQSRVLVVAASSKLDNIEPALRRPGRLDLEVEVGVPDARQRREILLVKLSDTDHELSAENIDKIAADTHGFVGADVEALVSQAAMKAKEDHSRVTFDHFVAAKTRVKPSGMREVAIEIPQVSWTDIGGLDNLKLKLRQVKTHFKNINISIGKYKTILISDWKT